MSVRTGDAGMGGRFRYGWGAARYGCAPSVRMGTGGTDGRYAPEQERYAQEQERYAPDQEACGQNAWAWVWVLADCSERWLMRTGSVA